MKIKGSIESLSVDVSNGEVWDALVHLTAAQHGVVQQIHTLQQKINGFCPQGKVSDLAQEDVVAHLKADLDELWQLLEYYEQVICNHRVLLKGLLMAGW